MIGFPKRSSEAADLPVPPFDHEFTEFVPPPAESFDGLLLGAHRRRAGGPITRANAVDHAGGYAFRSSGAGMLPARPSIGIT
jgi:hypothetical protein